MPLSSSVMAQYFGTLSMEDLVRLQEIYKADFIMFQYKPARIYKLRGLGRSRIL